MNPCRLKKGYVAFCISLQKPSGNTTEMLNLKLGSGVLIGHPDVTSDLAGVDAPLRLRPAGGCLSRVDPEVLICDPAVEVLQSGLPLHPAPQLLLHLLDLNTSNNSSRSDECLLRVEDLRILEKIFIFWPNMLIVYHQ